MFCVCQPTITVCFWMPSFFDFYSLFCVQSIDLTREEIVLEDAEDSLDANAIASHISSTKPGYHLYLFKHTHEGDYLESFGKGGVHCYNYLHFFP